MAGENPPFEPYRREIPPRINPDTEDMIKQITGGYEDAKGHLTYLESEFERLVRFELIEPMAGHRLARDCRGMQKTLYANTLGAPLVEALKRLDKLCDQTPDIHRVLHRSTRGRQSFTVPADEDAEFDRDNARVWVPDIG